MSMVEPVTRRWTVEEYYRAAAAGVFGPEERLELVDGEIYRMSPQHGPHATACQLTEDALSRIFRRGYVVRGQKPLSLGASSEPEPDVCVVTGRVRDFARSHPTTALLVVEVADSTVQFDLGLKAATYARAGIAEYWVIVIPQRMLVLHRDPRSGQYGSITHHGESDTVFPLAAPTAAIRVADLLP